MAALDGAFPTLRHRYSSALEPVRNNLCYLREILGQYVLLSNAPAGRDATQDFEEIGHSNSAKRLLEKYIIGKYEVRVRCALAEVKGWASSGPN